jgi:hypothetical protein
MLRPPQPLQAHPLSAYLQAVIKVFREIGYEGHLSTFCDTAAGFQNPVAPRRLSHSTYCDLKRSDRLISLYTEVAFRLRWSNGVGACYYASITHDIGF